MRRKPLTLKQINKKLNEGYGSGQGIQYKPFLVVQNVSTNTTVTRIRGLKIRRIYHLFSFLEVACFHILEEASQVIDIREQVPLVPLRQTIDIANRLGITHPGLYRGGRSPQMMTTDFLIDIQNEGYIKLMALCVKPSERLKETRIREKLEIEQFYWWERGIEWKIVTEKDMPDDLVKNLQWLYSTRNWYEYKPSFPTDLFHTLEGPLYEALADENRPFGISAFTVDQSFGLKPGTCLDIFRYFLAIGYWKVDMLSFIDTAKPIKVVQNTDITFGGGRINDSHDCSQIHY